MVFQLENLEQFPHELDFEYWIIFFVVVEAVVKGDVSKQNPRIATVKQVENFFQLAQVVPGDVAMPNEILTGHASPLPSCIPRPFPHTLIHLRYPSTQSFPLLTEKETDRDRDRMCVCV